MILLVTRKKTLTFPRCEKTFRGAGQPSTKHKQEGVKGGCVDSDYRVWTETAKHDERVCKEYQQVK